MSGRPLDVLEAAVGDDVEVRLKSGETYRGTLAGYDQHMNLVLDAAVVATVDATGSDPADDASDDDGKDGEEDATVGGDEPPADGQDTTIIRGDNVVSITP